VALARLLEAEVLQESPIGIMRHDVRIANCDMLEQVIAVGRTLVDSWANSMADLGCPVMAQHQVVLVHALDPAAGLHCRRLKLTDSRVRVRQAARARMCEADLAKVRRGHLAPLPTLALRSRRTALQSPGVACSLHPLAQRSKLVVDSALEPLATGVGSTLAPPPIRLKRRTEKCSPFLAGGVCKNAQLH
jgi:hypothetical protein